ncbi:MAG: T9SS type A sorting domain-containing protein, partial [Bacteroidota bacterium]
VKKWDGSSSWNNVGTGVVSASTAGYNSLLIDKLGNPVVAFQDGANGYKTSVYRYIAGAWTNLISLGSTTTSNTRLKINSNGDYYVGYAETSQSISVKKFDGSSWTTIGSSLTSVDYSANTFDMELDDADTPYLLAIATSTPELRMFKFNGSSWTTIVNTSNTSGPSYNVALSLDLTGKPFIFHVDNQATNSITVRTTNNPIALTAQPANATACNGASGSLFIGYSGGPSPAFQWQTLSAGSFTNVAGANSAVYVYSATPGSQNYRCVLSPAACNNVISNPAIITVNTLSISTTFTNPTCANTSDGAISASVTGGNAPYTYSWSPIGSTNSTATGLYGTTYTLNITDNSGCMETTTLTLSTPPSINSYFSGNQNICLGSSTTLTVIASGGIGAFTYSWSPSINIAPTTGSVVTVNPSSSITYGVQITDAIGCVSTNTVGVNIVSSPTISVSPTGAVICSGSGTGISASGSSDTYVWNPGNLSGSSQFVSPTSTTIYTVVGTNTITGCQASENVTVTVNPTPTVSGGPNKVLTCSNTTTVLTGSTTGGVTYNWTGPGIVSGGTTLNPTVNAVGTYDLNVISAAGCSSAYSPVTVTQNITPPSPTATNSGSVTCSAPNSTLTGLPATGVTYLWSGPGITGSTITQTTTANAAGSYTLKVTSSVNGCTNTAVTNLLQNTTVPSPTATNLGPLTCSTTTVTLNGSPAGLTYLWSGPGIVGPLTAQSTQANAPGTYTLKVTNSVNGCTNTAVTTVIQNTTPPIATASASGTLTCLTNSVALSGGPGTGVTYLWAGPGITGSTTTPNTTANAAGNYTLKTTGTVNGCTNTAVTAVTQNTVAPLPTAGTTGTLTCTTLTVALNGGPAGLTYLWTGAGISGSTTTQNTIANAAGTYTLKVTNSVNGCINTAVTTVTQNTLSPTATASTGGTLTCVNTNVTLTGTGGGTYNWSGPGIASGAATSSPVITLPGCYNLTVTAANSCTAGAITCVTQNTTSPTVNAGSNQSLTCSSSTVSLTGSATPSTCTPVWTGGVLSGANSYTAIASNPGVYTLTATDPNNGCTAADQVQVTANASIPTITVAVSNTLTCSNTTVNISSSTFAALPNYLWSGPSVVSGSNTANATVDQPGVYTITITDVPTGCSSTSTVNVTQDIALPVITVAASPSVICSGNSSTLTANGATTYTWSSGPVGNIIVVSPLLNTTYSVTGTGANGCSDITSQLLTVNATPVLSVTGNTTICKGSTTLLNANGATSYTWSTGANTNTIAITPTITTTYTVDGDNGNGCSASITSVVSIISSKTISGVISSTMGATGGEVILYKYSPVLTQWDSVTFVPLTSSYSFNSIDSGLYVIRAVPSATNIQVTYADSAISWQDATVVNHGCTNNTTQNIKLIPLSAFVIGPGVITGSVMEAQGFGHRTMENKPMVPGTPIGGIIVKGGKNPGGSMFVQTTTAADGTYTLTGLPINSGTDSYFVLVDIPGLDTNGTYHLVITPNDTVFSNKNFTVDSIYIYPVGSITGLSTDKSVLDHKIVLFPNPASQKFTLEYQLTQSANVQIELFDMVGQKVKVITANAFEEKNKYSHTVNLDDLSTGVYFVKLKINDSYTTIKLLITQ